MDLGEIRIRELASTDRGEWLRLRAELWPDHAPEELAHEVDSHFSGDGLWRLGTTTIPFRVLVAEHPTEGLVGFVEASLRPFAEECRTAPVGYLEGWYVVPGQRRRGVGRALVRAAEGWARAQGCREMASDAHLENTVSERSHRALGYEVVDRTVHFRRALS